MRRSDWDRCGRTDRDEHFLITSLSEVERQKPQGTNQRMEIADTGDSFLKEGQINVFLHQTSARK